MSDLKVPWMFRIQGNALSEVTAFPYMENLTSISFRSNHISKIDEAAFMNLTNLEYLDLSYNNLTEQSLDPEIFRGPFTDKAPDPIPLKELKLAHNKITSLPKNCFQHVPNLTSLDLSYNDFVDLSIKTAQAISELRKLEKLDLSYTRLARLPDHFFAELRNLVELDLSGNEFFRVPAEVNFAHSLRTLSLNDNLFGTIGANDFWSSLNQLETLNLKQSRTLYQLGNGAFGNLTSLRTLFLSDNPQLSDVYPLAFTNSKNETLHLLELHLEGNDLSSLPIEALPWHEIPYLNLQSNPWNCDCKFEWIAKDVIPAMVQNNNELASRVTCANPQELIGHRVASQVVQDHKFVCQSPNFHRRYGFIVVATIVVGTLLLVTGTIIFSYVLFRRAKIHDWVGENVKYRRTMNEDEEIITSNVQY
ncbi:UNVERIFIED_CONTAM: hypothetical protein GTU68_030591 [Idotea baltica]|nr:hypothetical protein [Idotea baltica]